MAIAEQLEKFSKTPPQIKAAVVGGLSVLIWALFLFMFYFELSDKVEGLEKQIARLQEEKANYEDKKQKYMAFRAEVTKLLEEQKELVKVLPSQAEIPAFLQSIHAQAELAGLNIKSFQQRREQRKGFYAKIPVAMTITGAYHQINKFFYAIGNMKRIVNISDLKLGGAVQSPNGVVLKASFTASTFRFLSGKKG